MDDVTLGRTITHINVVANSNSSGSSNFLEGPPPAHFRLFFALERSYGSSVIESVEVDSNTENAGTDREGNQLTILRILRRNYEVSIPTNYRTIIQLKGPLRTQRHKRQPFRVYDLISLLVTNRRYRYYLDRDTGSGCRWFCEVVLEDIYRDRKSVV